MTNVVEANTLSNTILNSDDNSGGLYIYHKIQHKKLRKGSECAG